MLMSMFIPIIPLLVVDVEFPELSWLFCVTGGVKTRQVGLYTMFTAAGPVIAHPSSAVLAMHTFEIDISEADPTLAVLVAQHEELEGQEVSEPSVQDEVSTWVVAEQV